MLPHCFARKTTSCPLYFARWMSLGLVLFTGQSFFSSCLVAPQSRDALGGEWQNVNLLPSIEVLEKTEARLQGADRVVVAVLDTGFEFGHPLLQEFWHLSTRELRCFEQGVLSRDCDGDGFAGNVLGWDFLGDDGIPDYRLFRPGKGRDILVERKLQLTHGTAVASLIVASPELKSDIRVRLLPFRIFPYAEQTGSGSLRECNEAYFTQAVDHILQAFQMAKAQDVKIVNFSLGFVERFLKENRVEISPYVMRRELQRLERYIQRAWSDVVIVAAAGNDTQDLSRRGENQNFPCHFAGDRTLCVGSLDREGRLSEFSSLGLQFVDIFAPGEDVPSAVATDHSTESIGRNSNSGDSNLVQAFTGTSFAAPQVTAALAHMSLRAPCLTALQIRKLLLASADVSQAPVRVGSGENYRYRVLNVSRALKATSGQCD